VMEQGTGRTVPGLVLRGGDGAVILSISARQRWLPVRAWKLLTVGRVAYQLDHAEGRKREDYAAGMASAERRTYAVPGQSRGMGDVCWVQSWVRSAGLLKRMQDEYASLVEYVKRGTMQLLPDVGAGVGTGDDWVEMRGREDVIMFFQNLKDLEGTKVRGAVGEMAKVGDSLYALMCSYRVPISLIYMPVLLQPGLMGCLRNSLRARSVATSGGLHEWELAFLLVQLSRCPGVQTRFDWVQSLALPALSNAAVGLNLKVRNRHYAEMERLVAFRSMAGMPKALVHLLNMLGGVGPRGYTN